ncbi:hypothetical protein [Nocardia sp. NPDC057455]|uniref:hypothetical protein n=1 Tax=Nocardia sp. NPDC057455 TaxID=3346138 RepID=UPI00366F2DED
MNLSTPPTFVCPECRAVSHHPEDIRQRYCGRCHRHYPAPTRHALAVEFARAAVAVSAVGMPLERWAGLGDWAALPQRARDAAGQEALRHLDEAFTLLTVLRAQLGEALDTPGESAGQ